MKKVILAYSGGLDTSVCVKWLVDRGYSVVAYAVDVGQGSDFAKVKKRAKIAGASKFIVEDRRKEFVSDFVLPTLAAGAVYESKYYLATALSRPLIAKGLVEAAKKEKAKYIAHGCTGKGNDQVRIEVSVSALDPNLEVIAPVRVWELATREAEMRYAKIHGIPVTTTKKSPYSIDKNLWGVSIECGVLEDPWVAPPKGAYQLTKDPDEAPKKEQVVTIDFKKGVPAALNGNKMSGIALISKLNKLGGLHGVGRTDLVENRLVGIKSREIYEAPAAVILHEAHDALESLVLDRELLHFKKGVSLKYAEMIYYGLWYTPLKEALDKFVAQTQKAVTGRVRVKLHKGTAACIGRKSKYSLYKKELATYDKGDKFDRAQAEGFIKLWGLPYRKQR